MRDIETIECSCGGKPEEVDTTPEEERKYGCGRQGCCVRAVECPKCHTRFTMSLSAPEDVD